MAPQHCLQHSHFYSQCGAYCTVTDKKKKGLRFESSSTVDLEAFFFNNLYTQLEKSHVKYRINTGSVDLDQPPLLTHTIRTRKPPF
jgi:hypothetical protein